MRWHSAWPAWFAIVGALVLRGVEDPLDVRIGTLVLGTFMALRILVVPRVDASRWSSRMKGLVMTCFFLVGWALLFLLTERLAESGRFFFQVLVFIAISLIEETWTDAFVRRVTRSLAAGAICMVAVGTSGLDLELRIGAALVLGGFCLLAFDLAGRTRHRPQVTISGALRERLLLMGLLVTAIGLGWIIDEWNRESADLENPEASIRNETLTGFTAEVTLGGMSRLKNDDRLAMQVEVRGPRGERWTHEEGEATTNPPLLLRGQALDQFDGLAFRAGPPGRAWTGRPWRVQRQRVSERITVRPHGGTQLFCLGIPDEVTDGAILDGDHVRWEVPFGEAVSYEVASREIYPADRGRLDRLRARHPDPRYLALPAGLDDEIRLLGKELVADAPERDHDRVRFVRDWLQREGGFQYARRDRNGGPDPLKAFLFETRTGHCEYFATAMVVLLRAGGLPARLAVGFRGGTYDERREHYRVLRSNAHAWVEVPFQGAGWVPFDPTPGENRLDVAVDGRPIAGAEEAAAGGPGPLEALDPGKWNDPKRVLPLLVAAAFGLLLMLLLGRRLRTLATDSITQSGVQRDPAVRWRRLLVKLGAPSRDSATLRDLTRTLPADRQASGDPVLTDAINAWRFDPDAGDDARAENLGEQVRVAERRAREHGLDR